MGRYKESKTEEAICPNLEIPIPYLSQPEFFGKSPWWDIRNIKKRNEDPNHDENWDIIERNLDKNQWDIKQVNVRGSSSNLH